MGERSRGADERNVRTALTVLWVILVLGVTSFGTVAATTDLLDLDPLPIVFVATMLLAITGAVHRREGKAKDQQGHGGVDGRRPR